MIFNKSSTTTEQGDIGEAKAIYEFIKRGFVVSKPINDKARYDLIVDDGSNILRVQVKTTKQKCKRPRTGYKVKINSTYSNRNATHIRGRQDGDYDILFVLTEEGRSWIIPESALVGVVNEVTVGTSKYKQYEIGE